MGCHFLLQGIFLTQGSNSPLLSFLHWQVDSLPLSHLGSPTENYSGLQIITPKGGGRTSCLFISRTSCLFINFPSALMGFPDSSVKNQPAMQETSAGFLGEGIVYPLQYSWASLVAQLVKNLPSMGETWVGSLGWEDPIQKGKATYSSILAWRIPWTI